ncbi:MAG: Na-translocating system protein MpsC family protein [Pirellulaceae bacterium]
MPTERPLRILVVDNDRDGADALGLLMEGLGNDVHVTYGGMQALDVASVFRPDLMLIDLAMPQMDGCRLVTSFRQMPAFAHTKIVAITGHADQGHKTLAMKAGFDMVLFKPVAQIELTAVLTNVIHELALTSQAPGAAGHLSHPGAERRLSIGEARRIRSDRASRTLTQAECEAAICEGIVRFREDYLGWQAKQIRVYIVNDLLVVRLQDVLTVAERQLVNSLSPEKGRDLVKEIRKHLLELARPMFESIVYEVTGVKVMSMHHDISTATGEEVVLFALSEAPRF